jgi:ribonuclease Y
MEIILIILGVIMGGAVGYAVRIKRIKQKEEEILQEHQVNIKKAEKELESISKKIDQASNKIEESEIEAKRKAVEIIEEAKKEEQKRREQLMKHEERILKKEEGIDKKQEEAVNNLKQIEELKKDVDLKKQEVDDLYQKQRDKLSEIAKLKPDEAKELLLKQVEEEAKDVLVKRYQQIEVAIKEDADKKAKNIIAHAIQKYAAEVASESTSTVVVLPNDEMKGRVIGREGRNINAFEQATGVDVIVDDTPGSILISGFDLVRRFTAKRALEQLIEDGRIHPARIEEIVEKAKKEVNVLIKEFGEKAVFETGITGLPPDLIKIIGRLRFRTSYGQNILKHSMEVAFIAAALAEELGADVKIAKTAAFLHDIGKAVDHEIEGPHALIGRDILKKFKIDERIVHAVAAHHEDIPMETLEDYIVQAADAISGSRPGARRESIDAYIRRLKELEETAASFPGVENVYAIQAGREVRVFVSPDKVDDVGTAKLAYDIAAKIEQELSYPGQVKVHVVREKRVVEFAK